MILELIDRGGPVMWGLFLGAFVAFAMLIIKAIPVIKLMFHYRHLGKLEEIRQHLKENNFAEAKACCLPGGPLQRLIDKGIESIESDDSLDSVKDRLEMIYDDELHRLESGMGIVLILGEIMPMLGLLGTVAGMIHVFEAISAYGTSDAQALAAGISEALLTTETGLVLAIPILFLYTVLINQIDTIAKHMRYVGGFMVSLQRAFHEKD
jgi:biopolymer transport protein ExbB